MTKKRPVGLLTALCCMAWLVIIIAMLFTALRLELKDRDGFLSFYEAYGIEQRTGLSPESATDALMALVDYMEGDRDSIQLTVMEYGKEVEMYSEDEISHMVDVYRLYQGFAKLLPAAIICMAALLAIWLYSRKKGLPSPLLRGYLWGLGLFVLLGGELALWAVADFTSFWTAFHLAFFTNDLWLMDPAVSRMIRICPESLFSGIAGRMALKTGLTLGLLCVLMILATILHKRKKQ